MAIQCSNARHDVNWLMRHYRDKKLNMDISIQRGEVWGVETKSNLIVSLLLGIPVENLLFEETEDDDGYLVLDGKQRALALGAFVQDGFALSLGILVEKIAGTPLVGKKFSDLPEKLKLKISEYELGFSILRPLSDEERAQVFYMRNQAVGMSKIDLSRVLMGEEAMDTLAAHCGHRFMKKKVKLTEPARRKHHDLRCLLQYLVLREKPEFNFFSADIMQLCRDIKRGVVGIQAEEITAVLDFLDEAIPEKKQYLKKVHIPIVLYTAHTAKAQGLSARVFGERLDVFFSKIRRNEPYMASCLAGSAKRANVQIRVKSMSEILREPNF